MRLSTDQQVEYVQRTINKFAFELHEAQFDSSKWDHERWREY